MSTEKLVNGIMGELSKNVMPVGSDVDKSIFKKVANSDFGKNAIASVVKRVIENPKTLSGIASLVPAGLKLAKNLGVSEDDIVKFGGNLIAGNTEVVNDIINKIKPITEPSGMNNTI
jgi:hypothetical protein